MAILTLKRTIAHNTVGFNANPMVDTKLSVVEIFPKDIEPKKADAPILHLVMTTTDHNRNEVSTFTELSLVDIQKLAHVLVYHQKESKKHAKMSGAELPTDSIKELAELGYAIIVSAPKKEAKKPILTTKDGVNIFEGDNYFILNRYNQVVQVFEATQGNGKAQDCFYFSSKQAADDFKKSREPIKKWSLDIAIPQTTLLFVTKDGLGIYDSNQTVYELDKRWAMHRRQAAHINPIKNDMERIFSTDTAAEDFRIMNKFSFSAAEILNGKMDKNLLIKMAKERQFKRD